ncbi:unnamed protein product [Adineta steineri]|uniref:aralkylamine N-acetyltransferase n=1 Tax=Adineta steineri TaxID=433720 RepID=A0A818XST3_9BILA|nr:unnamed protein product [Adineta steineri]CAF1229047.1 unnamed protein product [Adineta steineri]CAF1328865.1 unnamed protein product [Adineta steineri]CAF3740834.1 unnamed protein product [Adineta steineri]
MASLSTSSNIEIIPLLPEHRQSVINLLMSSFFIQEPLNAMLQFDIPQEPLAWADHVVDESLRDQCSFVAIDTQNLHKTIVGVSLNGVSNRTNKEEPFMVESEKLNFIFSLIDKVSDGYDLFDLYNTDRLFHFDIINVDENLRRQNVSGRLISASEDKARQLGIQGAFVVCSSLYSRKAFERRQYEVVNEILYSKYGDERLKHMGEHDRCTLLAKRL